MEKEKLEGLIIDYIDNKLTAAERQHVEQELVRNPDAYKLYEELREVIQVMIGSSMHDEPSASLRNNFDAALKQEVAESKKSKVVFFQPIFYRAAAAVALIIMGVAIGNYFSTQNQQTERLSQIEKEMEATRLMMMGMLENQQSPSQRIRGVNVALTVDKADDEIVEALMKTLNEDSNTNVRLAALDALSKFSNDASVRKRLISALSTQKDPVVQIALIQLMVQMKEKGIVNDLQRMVKDAATMQVVKDEAYSGIMKLS